MRVTFEKQPVPRSLPRRRRRLVTLIAVAGAMAIVFAIDRRTEISHVQHLYYFPIIVAAIRFGATSGVGTAAIQLLRAAGARVIATAGSEAKLALCRELGADPAISYKAERFADGVLEATGGRGADVVLDFVGAPYWDSNMAALALGGRLMLIGFLGGSRGQLDLGALMGKSLAVASTTLRRTPLPQKIALTQAFAAFALPRFERGELRPVIDRVLPIAQAAAAHRVLESNSNAGKVVLAIA